jgi:hypothetical protein
MSEISDLERRLGDLGRHLDVRTDGIADAVLERIISEQQPDVATAVVDRLIHRRRQRRLMLGLAAALLIATPVAAAILKQWVIGGSKITRVTSLPAPTNRSLSVYGARTSLARAQNDVAFPILQPASDALGSVVEIRSDTTPPGGRVTLLYPPNPRLPALAVGGVGAALTELRATTGRAFFGKMVTQGTTVTTFTLDGEPAIWLSGDPHVIIYHAQDGIDYADTVVLAGNVLLWRRGSLLLRLETNLDLQHARVVADSVQ